MTVDRVADPMAYYEEKSSKRRTCWTITWLLSTLLFAFLAFFFIEYDLLEMANTERIKVRPGYPAFEKWKNPPVPIIVKVYVFGVTNSEAFLNGTDTKLKLEEVGPIVYHKYIKQKDIVFEEDSTLSFSTEYDIKFPEEENIPGLLNKTLMIPNPMILGISAIIKDKVDNFLVRGSFNIMINNVKDKVFLNRTVYEILWNMTSPTLENIKNVLPRSLVPRPNAGLLYNSFYPVTYRYNVNIGTKHGFKNFFKINTLNGKTFIPCYNDYYKKSCPFGLKGASEGTGFPPYTTKNDTIYAFTNNLPRTYDMAFNRELKHGNLDVYEFKFKAELYTRNKNDSSRDCLRKTGSVNLPNGLMDTSAFTFQTPIALSPPHFYEYDGEWNKYLDGLNPNKAEHDSYMIIEPKTGVQMKALARIQSNLILPELQQTSEINRFSKMIIPQMWMEYGHTFDDKLILTMAEILLVYMPVLGPILIMTFLFLTFFGLIKTILAYKGVTVKELLHSRNKEITYPNIIPTSAIVKNIE